MELVYRRAGLAELDALVNLRKRVLISANGLPGDADLSHMDACIRAYFSEYGHQATFVCLCAEEIVGVGSVDYHTEMPTYSNPTGRVAFLMNIYTHPDFRRRGIAKHIVQLLLEDAQQRGAGAVLLEATAMGAPLYRSVGFVDAGGYMKLKM